MGQEIAAAASKHAPTKGQLTRQTVARAAADLASVVGLEGLSIAALADAVGMSKAGVYGHFGSKYELQLAAIESGRSVVRETVFEPAMKAAPGVARLWALLENFIAYDQAVVFPGGCMFANCAAELDAQPGPLRAEMAKSFAKVVTLCADMIREAQAVGELDAKADPQQLAFELIALHRGAAQMFRLDDDPSHFARARFAMAERLRPLLTDEAPELPDVAIPKRRERVPGTPARGT